MQNHKNGGKCQIAKKYYKIEKKIFRNKSILKRKNKFKKLNNKKNNRTI